MDARGQGCAFEPGCAQNLNDMRLAVTHNL